MRSDHHVDAAVGKAPDDSPLICGGCETAEHLDVDRIRRKPGPKHLAVLASEDGGGNQHGDLFAVLNRLECGANGHLGLAISDVAADQPVHRLWRLHIVFDRFDCRQLIGCLLEGERLFKFVLPRVVWSVGEPFGHLTGFVQLDQLVGHLLDLGSHFGLLACEV